MKEDYRSRRLRNSRDSFFFLSKEKKHRTFDTALNYIKTRRAFLYICCSYGFTTVSLPKYSQLSNFLFQLISNIFA